jgi:hypothetical protein
MALTESYLTTTKNLDDFLEAIKNARAPEKFTLKFLEDLDFKSTNDRFYIAMLKGLKFLDENGTPTQRYFDFLDDSQSSTVLAQGIQDAYEDLFRLNKKANLMTLAEVKGKLRSLTEGKKSQSVIDRMAATFVELSKRADFNDSTPSNNQQKLDVDSPANDDNMKVGEEISDKLNGNAPRFIEPSKRLIDGVTYRIEVVLPAVRDKAIYDAIFRSLKEHLL